MEIKNDPKKILVTGAAGFLGSHLVEKLIASGFKVRAFIRKTSNSEHLNKLNIEYYFGDLADKESIQAAVEGVDLVIHAAAAMSGNWEEYLNTNVKATENLLEAAYKAGVKRFIYISSILVHDIRDYSAQKPITEETAFVDEKNADYYTKSKIMAEKIVNKFHQDYKLPTVIIRPGLIYGERGKLYIPRIGYPLGYNRFLVIGRGKNRLPAVYVKNLVDAIILCLENEKAIGQQSYNFIDEQELRQGEYLNKAKETVNTKLAIIKVPYQVMLIATQFLGLLMKMLKRKNPFLKRYMILCNREFRYSNEKAKKDLDWHSKVSKEEALNRTMQWHKADLTPQRKVNPEVKKKNFVINKALKVGIVGCGQIALTHLPILKKIRGIEIVGLCDTNLENAQKTADKFMIKNLYSTLEEMITQQKPDVVHILTPPQSHKELSIFAMKNGCHVLVEKPMAIDAKEAQEMVEAAKVNKVKLCVGHNHLYDPIMLEARDLIARKALGKIVYVESWYGFNLGENPNSRYMTSAARNQWTFQIPGGLYQNLAPHPIGVLTDIIGYPEKIYALAKHSGVVKTMKSDELRVFLETKNAMGVVSVSLAVNPRYQTLNIYGTKMTLFLDFLNKTVVKQGAMKGIPKAISRTLMNFSQADTITLSTIRNIWQGIRKTFTYYEGTEILIREFYKSIEDNTPPPVSGEEGLKNMEIMDAIWKQINASNNENANI